MQILFIHQGFPAQFRSYVQGMIAQGHEVHAIGADPDTVVPTGCHFHAYGTPVPLQPHQEISDPGLENNLRRGERVADLALTLKASSGLTPDVVVVHSGWGEGLYLREIWPESVLIAYPELYGSSDLLQVQDPDSPPLDQARRRLLKRNNLMALAALADADAALTPTLFQRHSFPAPWRSRFQVIHEGVDCEALQPAPSRRIELKDGLSVGRSDPVLSFVSRSLEPMRGFGRLMRALPSLLNDHPHLQVVIVGGEGSSYSPPSPHPQGYLGALLEELGDQLDRERLHLPGLLGREQLTALFQVSTVHAYLSHPYVLSWSLLEAMACGAVVVASDTAPVRDVIRDGDNGLLVPLEDPGRITAGISAVLADPAGHQHLGVAARETVLRRFRRQQAVDSFSQWINSLVLLKTARQRQ